MPKLIVARLIGVLAGFVLAFVSFGVGWFYGASGIFTVSFVTLVVAAVIGGISETYKYVVARYASIAPFLLSFAFAAMEGFSLSEVTITWFLVAGVLAGVLHLGAWLGPRLNKNQSSRPVS